MAAYLLGYDIGSSAVKAALVEAESGAAVSPADELPTRRWRPCTCSACSTRREISRLRKLKWVKDNEPDVFARAHKAMLPGDYVALRMTGEAVTTPMGLSEGIPVAVMEPQNVNVGPFRE